MLHSNFEIILAYQNVYVFKATSNLETKLKL